MAKTRSFSDCFARYKTYDPSKDGYGDVSDWGKAFSETMGAEEARTRLDKDNPLFILGLTELPKTLEELKKVYRKLINIHHPDKGGDPAIAVKIIAAYSLLEDRIQRLKGKAL